MVRCVFVVEYDDGERLETAPITLVLQSGEGVLLGQQPEPLIALDQAAGILEALSTIPGRKSEGFTKLIATDGSRRGRREKCSMTRIRFSLRALLILATALILFLGYSQYRRRETLKASEELKKYGYFLDVPNAWHDRLWQRQPALGLNFYKENQELLRIDVGNEATEGKTIANLKTLGATLARFREFERKQEDLRLQMQTIARQRRMLESQKEFTLEELDNWAARKAPEP